MTKPLGRLRSHLSLVLREISDHQLDLKLVAFYANSNIRFSGPIWKLRQISVKRHQCLTMTAVKY